MVQHQLLGGDGTTREITPEDIFFALINGEEIGAIHSHNKHNYSQSNIDLKITEEEEEEEEEEAYHDGYYEISEIDYNDVVPVGAKAAATSVQKYNTATASSTSSSSSTTSRKPSSSATTTTTAPSSVFFQFAKQVRTRHELTIQAKKISGICGCT